MAKLSSANQQPGLDDLESLKRRYQRQNRELARANATQQQTISALTTEISQHSTENLRLRAEIISLRKQLDEKEAQGLTSVSAKAKTLLQEKLAEITGLINELSDNGVDRKTRIPGNRFPLAVKPDLAGRERPEGFLADIPEYNERVQPATPRRPFVCLGPRVDAIVRAAEEGSPIKDYYLPLQEFNSGMFDVRPRRKRNSNNSEFLNAGGAPVSTFNADLQASAVASPQKRKWDSVLTTEEPGAVSRSPMKDLDPIRPATPPPADPEEDGATLSTTARKEYKDIDTDVPSKKESASAASPVKLDLATASRFLSSNRRSLENVRDVVNQPTPERELTPEPEPEIEVESVPSPPERGLAPALVLSTESRRALEPKSTNVHVGLSPAKLPTVADFEYVKKDKTSPRDRESVKKASRISSKPIVVLGAENPTVEEKAAGGERSRRTRGVAVNYALPALNKKMRRDTEALVDAVTGIKPRRRTSTAEDGAVEDIEKRTSKMSIHYDAKRESERFRNVPDRSGSRMSEQELEKMMTEKVRDTEGDRDREREARIRETRKDLYEFATANSSATDALDIARRTSLGSHQRRTSGGLSGISALTSGKQDGDKMTAPSGNVKSASDIIEERRRRRATLAATGTSTTTATTGEVKARKSVEFADSVLDRERSGVTDRRRRSMIV
ncbi:hypothetical protein TWF718_004904 [Orbilia javanica]|uniref:Uncharacterized protein n=1 Tax=Orbilia javanica TaxID=47235 RepID=A0AAN8RLH2_9PEZI